jgi:hypothetical protein
MGYVWLALLVPLAGFLVNALLGRRLPPRAHGVIATAAIGCAFVVAVVVFFGLLGLPREERHSDLILYRWVTTGDGAGAWAQPAARASDRRPAASGWNSSVSMECRRCKRRPLAVWRESAATSDAVRAGTCRLRRGE